MTALQPLQSFQELKWRYLEKKIAGLEYLKVTYSTNNLFPTNAYNYSPEKLGLEENGTFHFAPE